MRARYVHTNLVARDWRKLADFYVAVFGCIPVPPERDLKGRWLDDATGLTDAAIEGIHLRLPGHGQEGPTLEIFQYGRTRKQADKAPNAEGLGHLAFAVDDVDVAVVSITQHGGSLVGKIVDTDVAGVGTIHFAYGRDPEGNIIEVQKWG